MPALAALLPSIMGMLQGDKSTPAAQAMAPPPESNVGGDIALGVGGLAVLGIIFYAVSR